MGAELGEGKKTVKKHEGVKCGWYLAIKARDASRKLHVNVSLVCSPKFLIGTLANDPTTHQEAMYGHSEISPTTQG